VVDVEQERHGERCQRRGYPPAVHTVERTQCRQPTVTPRHVHRQGRPKKDERNTREPPNTREHRHEIVAEQRHHHGERQQARFALPHHEDDGAGEDNEHPTTPHVYPHRQATDVRLHGVFGGSIAGDELGPAHALYPWLTKKTRSVKWGFPTARPPV